MAAYQARAPYQRNDDLGRISRPSRPETEEMRPRRMLDELARADVSMKRRYALGGRPRKQEEAAP